jgi:hypothetical protein
MPDKIPASVLKTAAGNRYYDADLVALRELASGAGPEYGSDLFVRRSLKDVEQGIAIVYNSKDILPQRANVFAGEEANRLTPDKVKGVVLFKDVLTSGRSDIAEQFVTPAELEMVTQMAAAYDKGLRAGKIDQAARQKLLDMRRSLNAKYFDQFVDAVRRELGKYGIPVEVR